MQLNNNNLQKLNTIILQGPQLKTVMTHVVYFISMIRGTFLLPSGFIHYDFVSLSVEHQSDYVFEEVECVCALMLLKSSAVKERLLLPCPLSAG